MLLLAKAGVCASFVAFGRVLAGHIYICSRLLYLLRQRHAQLLETHQLYLSWRAFLLSATKNTKKHRNSFVWLEHTQHIFTYQGETAVSPLSAENLPHHTLHRLSSLSFICTLIEPPHAAEQGLYILWRPAARPPPPATCCCCSSKQGRPRSLSPTSSQHICSSIY